MKMFELLQTLEEQVNDNSFTMEFVLNEDLGNFKGVQKGFLKAFKEYGQDKNKLGARLGKNSPFSAAEAKTTADAIRKFEGEGVAGFVIQVKDGRQLLAVAKQAGRHGGFSQDDVRYVVDLDWVMEKNPAAFEKASKLLSGMSGTKSNTAYETKFVKLHALMTAIIRAAKDNQLDPQIVMISVDAERAKLKGERATAKQGRVPTPKELKYMNDREKRQFADKFKQELRMRLEKYKSSKADGVDSPNDVLKLILEKGYVDKMKVGGFVYKRTDERINFRVLRGERDTFGGDSYIEYTVDENDSHYEQVRNSLWQKRKELQGQGMSEKDFEEAYEKVKEALPPRKIRVKLELKGAVIQPSGEVSTKDQY